MGISGIQLLLKEREAMSEPGDGKASPKLATAGRGGNGATGPMAELRRARSPKEHMQVSAATVGEGEKGAVGQQLPDWHLWRTGACLLSTRSFMLHICMVHCAGFPLQGHVKLRTSRRCCTFSDRPCPEARRSGAGMVPMTPGSWALCLIQEGHWQPGQGA